MRVRKTDNKQKTGNRTSRRHVNNKSGATDLGNPVPGSEKDSEIPVPEKTTEKNLNIMIDDVPYILKVSPFLFNGETRFYVSVNGGTDHVFTWDSELGRLRAIDDNSGILPSALEVAISQKLESWIK